MSYSDLRQQFPIFADPEVGKTMVYFDSAATTQKPLVVLDKIQQFYTSDNANVHRASHGVAQRATKYFEQARESLRGFINAKSNKEIIWTKGATESINLVANILGKGQFRAGGEILLSEIEHHANIVPWQQVAEICQMRLKVMPVNSDGILDLQKALDLISQNTVLLAVTHVSNALGNINPIELLIQRAKTVGALTLIDGTQAVAHMPVDVQKLDCDFYVFSGHKMFGPTGVGVLYGKEALLNVLPPYQFGGEMIESVSFEKTTFQALPLKYEAGTPNIAGVIALASAVKFIQENRAVIEAHEEHLYLSLMKGLRQIPGIRLWGESESSIALQSFTIEGVNNQDLGILLSERGFAVRVGHHCAMPLMQSLGIDGCVRVSLSCYNSLFEVASFLDALHHCLDKLCNSNVSMPLDITSNNTSNGSSTIAQHNESKNEDPVKFPLAEKVIQANTWDESYRQIMLAGKGLNRLSKQEQCASNEVKGCESQVWLKCELENKSLVLSADSQSKIVRGLLAIIFEPLQGKKAAQVADFDMQDYLQTLGLAKHLSQSRGNGLQAVLNRIVEFCSE
jgi:cysteine desulfurase/selenocysteine lyase